MGTDPLARTPSSRFRAWSAAGRADHGFAEAPQSRLESLFGNGPDGRPDPLPSRPRSPGERLGAAIPGVAPDLLQDDAPDAAPAVMDVHPFDHDRRQVLHLQRKGALDPHDERRGFRPRRRIDLRTGVSTRS